VTRFQLPPGREVDVPTVHTTYARFTGITLVDTYGGKPIVLDSNGRTTFAELAILRDFEAAGWRGVWVDSYRGRLLTDWPEVRGELDRTAARVFDRISQRRQGKSWDVVVSCGERVLFVESKRAAKDAIRDTQLRWLEAALDLRLTPDDFLLVEWSFA
jgi:hypothetical protein